MADAEDSKMTGVWLDPVRRAKFETVAETRGTTVSGLLRTLIDGAIEEGGVLREGEVLPPVRRRGRQPRADVFEHAGAA